MLWITFIKSVIINIRIYIKIYNAVKRDLGDYTISFKKKLTPQQYKTWANPLLLSENENSLEIIAPNHFIRQWISERFSKEIEALAKEHKY